jgi:cytochrome c-type biogenesis protein CcmH/NrfF
MPTWLIWVIVIIVVLAVIVAVVAISSKRRAEQRRARAGELRQEASTQAAGLTETERQADELRAKADLA